MSIVKIAAGLAGGSSILLLLLALFLQNPDTVWYEETAEILMEQEGLSSVQALESRYPALVDIKGQLQQINALNLRIRDQFQSPIPDYPEEGLQIDDMLWRVRQIRGQLSQQFYQLLTKRNIQTP